MGSLKKSTLDFMIIEHWKFKALTRKWVFAPSHHGSGLQVTCRILFLRLYSRKGITDSKDMNIFRTLGQKYKCFFQRDTLISTFYFSIPSLAINN